MKYYSIIIPFYNCSEELIKRCVDSILIQPFTDFEIIIVNDGSKEEYKPILTEIEKIDSRIKVFSKENGGASSARNFGILHASGKYYIFVDSDDVILPNFLVDAYSMIQNNTDIDFLIGGAIRFSESIPVISSNSLSNIEIDSEEKKKTLMAYSIKGGYKFGDSGVYFGRGPWARVVKAELVQTTLFDENLEQGEDIIWNLELIKKANKIIVIPQGWYGYYYNDNSITHRYNEKIYDKTYRELLRLEKEIDFHNKFMLEAYQTRIIQQCVLIFQCFLYNKDCTLTNQQKKELINKLYKEHPWNTLKYFNGNIHFLPKTVMYRIHVLFLYYKFKYFS